MELKENKKLYKSWKNLAEAIKIYEEKKVLTPELRFLTLSKTLEVYVEYVWKHLKKYIEKQGLFAPSPKEAIRQAAVLKLIEDPESWLKILNARNDSVHDYFSISEEKYYKIAISACNLGEKDFGFK